MDLVEFTLLTDDMSVYSISPSIVFCKQEIEIHPALFTMPSNKEFVLYLPSGFCTYPES